MTLLARDPQEAWVGAGVHSWDEFTKLREVVIGDASGARLPDLSDMSAWLTCFPHLTEREIKQVRSGDYPRKVIEEANEDLHALDRALKDLDVVTHRPTAVNHSSPFASPDWTSRGFFSYCPRDLTLILGQTIVETPSPTRARYFENLALRQIFQRKFDEGATWIAAPRPRLTDELFTLGEDGFPRLGEDEPAFDAANILRVGADLFYQVSRSGNERGYEWLKSIAAVVAPNVQVHPLRGVYQNVHIDSTITVLRPGLVLLNPERIAPYEVPAPFDQWDIVWCPQPEPSATNARHTLSESWISMNLLVVQPNLVIVESTQPALIKTLENTGIDVVPLTLRHAQTLGGGFHCVTLDLVREGECESYFDR